MVTIDQINEIFGRITETHRTPIRIGSRCESTVYYRTEYLSDADLDLCADYVANRIDSVIGPLTPDVFFKLPGGYSFFAERLCAIYSENICPGREIALEYYSEEKISNGLGTRYADKSAILVTDVITTAISSLEAHSKATLRGISVLAWASLVDRTFGPGPVPVVSAFSGARVRVLSRIG